MNAPIAGSEVKGVRVSFPIYAFTVTASTPSSLEAVAYALAVDPISPRFPSKIIGIYALIDYKQPDGLVGCLVGK